jgi:hypothetical protein
VPWAREAASTATISKKHPGAEKQANWLPAPDGQMALVMRMYLPKADALEGKWKPPAIAEVPAAVPRSQ